MQKRFCDLKVGDKIYEITNDHMFIDTITRILSYMNGYEFSLQDQTLVNFCKVVPLNYINESTYFNKDTGQLFTTDIKVFLNGL